MPNVKCSYYVYVKNKKLMQGSCHKSKVHAKVHGSCHVHATPQKFMKMVKSMNFVHDMAKLVLTSLLVHI